MDIRPVTENYSVSDQILPSDIGEIKAAGFRSIVCNRPDGEAADQPAFSEVAAEAERQGLAIRHIPIGPMGVTPDAVAAMVDALDEMDGPMLGYCRSGARSTAVFQQAQHLRN